MRTEEEEGHNFVNLDNLYQEYAKMIYRFIYLKCNDTDLAEDIVQTTFLKAILQINSFKNQSKISTWLCEIAKNEYLNYCRKYNRQQSYDEYLKNSEKQMHEESYIHDTMLEKVILSEQAEIIREILNTLNEPYKEVFMLRIYGEYSFREIANVFKKNDTWARVTYYRARKKILDTLRK